MVLICSMYHYRLLISGCGFSPGVDSLQVVLENNEFDDQAITNRNFPSNKVRYLLSFKKDLLDNQTTNMNHLKK